MGFTLNYDKLRNVGTKPMKKVKKISMMIILASVLISMVTGALVQAHEPLGGSWPSDYADNLLYMNFSEYDEVDYAIDDWDDSLGSSFTWTETGNPELMEVEFDDISGQPYEGFTIHYPDGKFEDYGYVLILLGTDECDSLPSATRRGVIAHEMGHAYGLAHENDLSGNPASPIAVMYEYTENGSYYRPAAVQDDDVAGVNDIY